MRRVIGPVVILEMAPDASALCIGELVVCMTLRAGKGRVNPGQWETRCAVIKGGARPIHCTMTNAAVGREP